MNWTPLPTMCIRIPFTLLIPFHSINLLEFQTLTIVHSISSASALFTFFLIYRTVLGIFGLKLQALLHWKPFSDFSVLFILLNGNDIDHFWMHLLYCKVIEQFFSSAYLCTANFKFLGNKNVCLREVNIRSSCT